MTGMRYCFVAHDRSNYRAGPIVNLRRLLPMLSAMGHDPLVLALYQDEPANAQWLIERGITCRVRRHGASGTEDHVRWFLEQLKELSPDVFVPNVSVPAYYAARWARQSGLITVGTMRSDDAFYWGIVDEFVCGHRQWALSGLVCVSEDLRTRVERRGPRHTALTMIPSGVPVPEVVSAQDGPLRFVYVGRLVRKAKSIHKVLAMMRAALKALPDTRATIIGEGREQEEIHRQIKEFDMGDRITLAGTLPPESLHEELSKHHVLVLFSDYEGSPGAVMDAMACGLVPVCKDIPGGVRELVHHEETGLRVSDHPDSFLEAVCRLARDPLLRKRLASNARRHALEHYSLAASAARWIEFGELLVAQPRAPSAIHLPRRIRLPKVHPGLAHEDRREPGPVRRLKQRVWRLARSARSNFAGVWWRR
jgi:colanic acid/amylovoran biosynthesis glycosyltransferase